MGSCAHIQRSIIRIEVAAKSRASVYGCLLFDRTHGHNGGILVELLQPSADREVLFRGGGGEL